MINSLALALAIPTALPFPTLPPIPPPTLVPTEMPPTALPFPTLPPIPPPTAVPTVQPLELPAAAIIDAGRSSWLPTQNWKVAETDRGLAWSMNANSGVMETLQWQQQIDLRGAVPNVMLMFDSIFSGDGVPALAVSGDGTNWQILTEVPASSDWTTVSVDLSSYIGSIIRIKFVWQAVSVANAQWSVNDIVVSEKVPTAPTSTLPPTASPTTLTTEEIASEQNKVASTPEATHDSSAP